jgi:RHS repeat-associated protein
VRSAGRSSSIFYGFRFFVSGLELGQFLFALLALLRRRLRVSRKHRAKPLRLQNALITAHGAELNTSGQTLREYIWLNDMPIAVVDNVNTTSAIYYVHVDHLMRPARMTDGSANWVWDVIFTPFGTTAYVNQNPAVMNMRFLGQWFQLETGLAYNWYRHYDATTGRYVQPDLVDLILALTDGPSIFAYVSSSPLAWVDRQGLIIGNGNGPSK